MFNISPRNLCRSASFRAEKCSRASLKKESSDSPADAHDGALWKGVGEGAGVGGEAGADGKIFDGGCAGRLEVEIRLYRGRRGRDLVLRGELFCDKLSELEN